MIGVVLAGGESRRFKQDKALYRLPGQCVNNAQLAVDKLSLLCDRVLVSANAKNVSTLTRQFAHSQNVEVISDLPPFDKRGPLSGIYAAACQFNTPTDLLILAVDYPYVSIEVLSRLADHDNCYARTPDADHYTLAHFSTTSQILHDFLMLDDYRLRHFITEVQQCDPISFANAELFINFNTPEADFHAH
ncbi:molybdenum cofactor guanylyltransferase [Lactobacillus sp. LC28-10]|uniref:Molybdenum cofactor guanylyltransferase n=2 Tax=Secundilactobacillus angelensis TaxID=2722706 RepID=A0ABX1KWG5_9LACO|nr:molybdenum cofactor guanylyltransferase [Secundilactobacillus angelensis]